MIPMHSHPQALTRSGRLRFAFGLTAVSVLLLGYGAWRHVIRDHEASANLAAANSLTPEVRTVVVRMAEPTMSVDLPGSTEPFDNASIYPRATGYVAKLYVDIGSRVRKGQLLATIESPELDQRLTQALAELKRDVAALAQAQANVNLSAITSERYRALAAKKYATQQEADTYRLTAEARLADLGSAKALVESQQAEVQRLKDLAKFEKVEAPFDGVITSRRVDQGDLSNADASNLVAGGNYLFKEANDSVLRVRIDIPQSAAVGVKDGLTAQVTIPENPGKAFNGRIARIADSLSSQTRTMQVEVDLDNQDHAIKPGLYVTVHLDIPRNADVVRVPGDALIFNHGGMQVAVVENGRIRLQPVSIGLDQGVTVDVTDGLKGGERLVLNPFVDMTDGLRVEVAEDKPAPSIAEPH